MAVEVSLDRKALEFTYDQDQVDGETIDVHATNPETGDVSRRTDLANDGRFVLTFPADYTGTTHVEVEGSEGGSDEGTVTV